MVKKKKLLLLWLFHSNVNCLFAFRHIVLFVFNFDCIDSYLCRFDVIKGAWLFHSLDPAQRCGVNFCVVYTLKSDSTIFLLREFWLLLESIDAHFFLSRCGLIFSSSR